jgi:hypothetical protein
MGTLVGRAYVNPLDIYGKQDNTLPSEFHYMPSNPGDATAESLLTAYLETKDQIPITIQGDAESSPYGSLDQALSGLTLSSSYVLSFSTPTGRMSLTGSRFADSPVKVFPWFTIFVFTSILFKPSVRVTRHSISQ